LTDAEIKTLVKEWHDHRALSSCQNSEPVVSGYLWLILPTIASLLSLL
jgi:hypothetical protein